MIPAFSNEPLVIPGVGLGRNPRLDIMVNGRPKRIDGRFSRPNWCCFSQFPAAAELPPGRYGARLSTANGVSANVDIEVQPGPSLHRVLVPARNGARQPYTILILANAVFKAAGGLIRDPLAADQPRFGMMVSYILDDLLNQAEDLVSIREARGAIQFEIFRDPALPITDANALAGAGRDPKYGQPLTQNLRNFLLARGLWADVVYIVHGVDVHRIAYAYPALDDLTREKKSYLLDGKPQTIGRFTQTPGAVAIWSKEDQAASTAMHEFGHAASEGKTFVHDLYNDLPCPGIAINKRFRTRSADPVPQRFADYEGRAFASAADRWTGQAYRATYRSYAPERTVAQLPNLMDAHQVGGRGCRFDRLTAQWFADRLDFKTART